jgi:hypothetical protein
MIGWNSRPKGTASRRRNVSGETPYNVRGTPKASRYQALRGDTSVAELAALGTVTRRVDDERAQAL